MINRNYEYKNTDKMIKSLKKLKKMPLPQKELSFIEREELNNMLSTNIPRTYIMPKHKSNVDKDLIKQLLTDIRNELVSKTKKFFGCIAKKAKP